MRKGFFCVIFQNADNYVRFEGYYDSNKNHLESKNV